MCCTHAVAQNHRKKLEERSKRVVHIGVEKGTKAYRLLDPITGSMYVSRNVVFEEDKVWIWEKTAKIKPTPGMSFTVEGFDFNEHEHEEVRPIPGTPNENVMSQPEEDWTEDASQPISS